jgi:hypothetical protein
MNEPAALTSPAAAGLLVLPPVTYVFRDQELDLLETRVTGAELAVRAARYDDAVGLLDELAIFPARARARSSIPALPPTAASSTTRSAVARTRM